MPLDTVAPSASAALWPVRFPSDLSRTKYCGSPICAVWNSWGSSKDNRVREIATAENLPVVRSPRSSSGRRRRRRFALVSEVSAPHPLFWSLHITLNGYIMATLTCRVQFLDDTDPFNSTNFPEPTRPPLYTFREDIPLINQVAGVHRLLKAPHKVCIQTFIACVLILQSAELHLNTLA